jgi:nitroreductase
MNQVDSQLQVFEQIVRRRRAVRHFSDAPLPDGVLDRLLDAARWAPSGYNLQPTHFVVVTAAELKAKLRPACMDQPQVAEAPATIVFCGDRLVAKHNFDRSLALDKQAGGIDERYEKVMRKFVPLAFSTGPAGLGWLWKSMLPLARLGVPIPNIPAVHRRYWLAKQVALSAMSFMLAATAADLATCPMEGFDETRVRRLLGIPRAIVPVLVVPVGYPAEGFGPDQITKTRLPLNDLVHHNGWRG